MGAPASLRDHPPSGLGAPLHAQDGAPLIQSGSGGIRPVKRVWASICSAGVAPPQTHADPRAPDLDLDPIVGLQIARLRAWVSRQSRAPGW